MEAKNCTFISISDLIYNYKNTEHLRKEMPSRLTIQGSHLP